MGRRRRMRRLVESVRSDLIFLIPENSFIFDIGANEGQFTETILSQRKVRAFLFEPVAKLAAICSKKFADYRHIHVFQTAIGHVDGKADIHKSKYNAEWNTLVKEMAQPYMLAPDSTESVQVARLDTFLSRRRIPQIDFMKIDVEGWEWAVIEGAKGTIKKHQPVIYCEVSWGKKHPQLEREIAAFNWLHEIGYPAVNLMATGKTNDVCLVPESRR